MNLHQAAVDTAYHYLGEKEIKGNQGFESTELDNYMRMVGFENGWAWCSIFSELCWSKEPYERKAFLLPVISDCFAANAVRTYENFEKDDSGYFEVGLKPKKGSVVIWEKVKDSKPVKNGIWTVGHAGIVVNTSDYGFESIEGNTNDAGGREGIEVAKKLHPYSTVKYGLRLKGFISLKDL